VPDILAIVSKAIFERDARADGELIGPGDIWPVDRYISTHKTFQALEGGGRIFLVTVRPPNEQLWFLGVVDEPAFDGSAWISETPNRLAVTDISALRKSITFESGKGMSQDRGTLGMSLQAPRALAPADTEQILAAVAGKKPKKRPAARPVTAEPVRVIGGKYEIIRELGRGGMGVVYEAKHTGTGRRVAVKEIVGDAAKKERKLIERFQREARATGAIETRHIAPVLDTGNDPATKNPYLVIELLKGEDLQEHINRVGTLPEDLAVRVVAQACTGLARAHEAGVVHRDIKPANLFLARRDDEVVVTLLDFGVARVKQELATDSLTLTSTGLMLGTPLYMSPEQVVGAKDLDHRTDLWSLGVVLYELIAGTTPYTDSETLGALLVAICSKPAKPLRDVVPATSGWVAKITAKALALDPAARYTTAEEMLVDLKAALPNGSMLDETMVPGPHKRGKRKTGETAFSVTSPSKP
jgi:eukaryotic-like serine/threonine-protein kinase